MVVGQLDIHMKIMKLNTSPTSRYVQKLIQGFPGGAVVKNPPANAGDEDSSPGLVRSHMPRSY